MRIPACPGVAWMTKTGEYGGLNADPAAMGRRTKRGACRYAVRLREEDCFAVVHLGRRKIPWQTSLTNYIFARE